MGTSSGKTGHSQQMSVGSYDKMGQRKMSKGSKEDPSKYKMQAAKKQAGGSYQNYDSGKRKSTASSEQLPIEAMTDRQGGMSQQAKNIMTIYGVPKGNLQINKKSSQFLLNMAGEQPKPLKRPVPTAYISTGGNKPSQGLHKKNLSAQMTPLNFKSTLHSGHHRSQSEYTSGGFQQGQSAIHKASDHEYIETEGTAGGAEQQSHRTMLSEYGRISDRVKYDTAKVSPHIRHLMAQSEFVMKDPVSVTPSNEGSYLQQHS